MPKKFWCWQLFLNSHWVIIFIQLLFIWSVIIRFSQRECLCVCVLYAPLSHSGVSDPVTPWMQPTGLSVHGDAPGRTTGVGGMPSSRGSSQPRDQTQVSCIAGRFFTDWATREAHVNINNINIWNINSFYLVGDLYDSLYIIESKKWACMDLLKCIFQRKYKTPGIQVKVVEKCIYWVGTLY